MDHSLLIQVGDKPHMLARVLKFVGPWLSWGGDWRNVEMLNKAINKWCQSEDAAMSLFGLWQERTVSLSEIVDWLPIEPWNEYQFDLEFINSSLPFLGHLDFNVDENHLRGCLYRSLFELSDLEEKVARNALNEGSCVRIDSLPIRGDDQWLLIDCVAIKKNEDCIPPYYFLERAVPKGLKIVLVDVEEKSGFPSRLRNVSKAVGRAAALGLDGLIIYDKDGLFTSDFSKSFISALQEQKDGEFESPLEILSFYHHGEGLDAEQSYYSVYNCQQPSLSDMMTYGVGSGKLRNLKYVNISSVELTEFMKEYLPSWNLPYTCPNLQVLEPGWIAGCSFPPSIQCPDNVYGPHNCCIHFPDNDRGVKTNDSSLLGLWIIETDEWFVTDLAKGLFSSLRVLMDTDLRNRIILEPQQGLGRALSIGCPALRFLQIRNSQLCAVRPTDWHELFKRLLVLIVECTDEDPIFDTALFPEGCELRVLTIGVYDSDHNALSWLENLLNIIDICLPKLLHLNVVWDLLGRSPLAPVLYNIKSQFRQKSVNLDISYDWNRYMW